MEYGIRELSRMAGVSARTLRYYDEIGLLKPKYVSEAGYRFYGEKEISLLQQILFYRERGFDLKRIQQIIYQEDFDIMDALQEHLRELKEQKARTDALIRTVRQTILSMKGEYEMTDKEKFEAFKENMVRENEEKYGKEVREKYGDDQMDASNRKMLNLSQEEWERFKELEKEILRKLAEGVKTGISPESEAGKEITELHKEWLLMTWKQYSARAHKGLASGYVVDERFKAYYDRDVEGCAVLLEGCIQHWADRVL